jgi:hypothetical protein
MLCPKLEFIVTSLTLISPTNQNVADFYTHGAIVESDSAAKHVQCISCGLNLIQLSITCSSSNVAAVSIKTSLKLGANVKFIL